MKKGLLIVFAFILTLSILAHFNNKEFSIENYLNSFDKLNELERPTFENLEFKTYKELSSLSNIYYFDYEQLCDSHSSLMYTEDFDIYLSWENVSYLVKYVTWKENGAGELQSHLLLKEYGFEWYEKIPNNLKEFVVKKTTDDFSDLEMFTMRFNAGIKFIFQPIQIIIDFIHIIWQYIIYLFNCLRCLTGGLIL